ncbi:MAG: hypothetical protein LBT42_01790 [Tannerella sp.]|jgi:hypothetical protein|nr:hypothetical protein [Tannerella sp.]
MKDITISVKRQKTELKWLLASFCTAFLLNILSIIMYATSWDESYSQLLWVLAITVILYAVSIGFRLLFYAIKKLF